MTRDGESVKGAMKAHMAHMRRAREHRGSLGDAETRGAWEPGSLGAWEPGSPGAPREPGSLGAWEPGSLGAWEPLTAI